MSDEKKLKLVVAEGAFDGVPPEEAEMILKEIQAMIDAGTLLENSEEIDLDFLAEDEPEMYEALMEQSAKALPTIH